MSFALGLLIAAHLIQAYFWLWSYRQPLASSGQRERSSVPPPGVSVVIAIKNESKNLTEYLPAVLTQEYPNFEVIVVDDHSTDDSGPILQSFAKKHPHLILLSAKEGHGKKKALSLGIKKAKHPWIINTDADCKPNSNQWIKTIISQHHHADIILGYGPYESKSTVLNAFINYETWYIAVQYMSAALLNRAYMGVGRNLCFRKSLWDEIGGYSSHQHLRSGDDDLFVSAAREKRVVIETDPRSWTISKATDSFSKLWEQKRRHLSTASSYSQKNQLLLSLNFFSALLVYCLTGILCYFGSYFVLIPLLSRFIYQYLVSRRWMNLLGAHRLWFSTPFWDFTLVIYYSAHGAFMWRQKKDW